MMRGLMRGAAIAVLAGLVLGVGTAVADIANMRSTWENGNLYWWDIKTSRVVYKGPWIAPVTYFDDFLGAVPLSATDTENGWSVVDVGTSASISTARQPNGIVRLGLGVTVEAEDAVLYWADQCAVDVGQGAIIEFYATFETLPTSTATSVVMGMGGLHNLDKDTMAEGAWFRVQGTTALLTESDDTTNNNDDTATGITLVAGTYNLYKIDFTTIADVKFYVDDTQVSTATTFDMSNLTATEAIMQPYFSCDKPGGADEVHLDIDWIRITGNRQ
jgi:hypothetical protein